MSKKIKKIKKIIKVYFLPADIKVDGKKEANLQK